MLILLLALLPFELTLSFPHFGVESCHLTLELFTLALEVRQTKERSGAIFVGFDVGVKQIRRLEAPFEAVTRLQLLVNVLVIFAKRIEFG